ncbi:MAG: hypothetical protein HUJ68_02750 [Clostridia bacterium]|nr:hypothetical protein [Clostridia bacterium]
MNEEELNPQTQEPQTNESLLTDENNMPIQSGLVPIDSNSPGISLKTPNIKAMFTEGNFNNCTDIMSAIQLKFDSVTRTIEPLIEVALIELLQSSDRYIRQFANIVPSFDDNGQFKITFSFKFVVSAWIVQEVDYNDVLADSQYILEKIKPTGAVFTKCEIDCTEGIVTIEGSI